MLPRPSRFSFDCSQRILNGTIPHQAIPDMTAPGGLIGGSGAPSEGGEDFSASGTCQVRFNFLILTLLWKKPYTSRPGPVSALAQRMTRFVLQSYLHPDCCRPFIQFFQVFAPFWSINTFRESTPAPAPATIDMYLSRHWNEFKFISYWNTLDVFCFFVFWDKRKLWDNSVCWHLITQSYNVMSHSSVLYCQILQLKPEKKT